MSACPRARPVQTAHRESRASDGLQSALAPTLARSSSAWATKQRDARAAQDERVLAANRASAEERRLAELGVAEAGLAAAKQRTQSAMDRLASARGKRQAARLGLRKTEGAWARSLSRQAGIYTVSMRTGQTHEPPPAQTDGEDAAEEAERAALAEAAARRAAEADAQTQRAAEAEAELRRRVLAAEEERCQAEAEAAAQAEAHGGIPPRLAAIDAQTAAEAVRAREAKAAAKTAKEKQEAAAAARAETEAQAIADTLAKAEAGTSARERLGSSPRRKNQTDAVGAKAKREKLAARKAAERQAKARTEAEARAATSGPPPLAARGGISPRLAAAARPEGIEERIAREKKERYEASDEYKQLVATKAEQAANVALASASQLSEQDVQGEKQSQQEQAGAAASRWVAQVTGAALEGEAVDGLAVEALSSGVVLCALANAIRPGVVRHKVSKSKMPFPQRENVNAFVGGARAPRAMRHVMTTVKNIAS